MIISLNLELSSLYRLQAYPLFQNLETSCHPLALAKSDEMFFVIMKYRQMSDRVTHVCTVCKFYQL